MRYIIDYYDIGDEDSYKSGNFVFLDCRPALDSLEAFVDRVRVMYWRWEAQFMGRSSSSKPDQEKPSKTEDNPSKEDNNS